MVPISDDARRQAVQAGAAQAAAHLGWLNTMTDYSDRAGQSTEVRLRVAVDPNGGGTLAFLDEQCNPSTALPVASLEEAIEALTLVWQNAQSLA